MSKKNFKAGTPRPTIKPITGDALDQLTGNAETDTLEEESKEKESLTDQPSNTNTSSPSKKKEAKIKIDEEAIGRRSFLVKEKTFDKLLDFIYFEKTTGRFWCTQESTIEEALQMLFSTKKSIPPRPEEERKRERERSQRRKR